MTLFVKHTLAMLVYHNLIKIKNFIFTTFFEQKYKHIFKWIRGRVVPKERQNSICEKYIYFTKVDGGKTLRPLPPPSEIIQGVPFY